MSSSENRSPQGDPNGRRLAKRRAHLLSDAERIGRALEVLLKRAGYPSDVVSNLVRDIARQQREELLKAHGRIEPRTRFKSTGGQPLHLRLPVWPLYVDESGVPHIQNGSYPPYFALGAVTLDDTEADRYREASDAIKDRFFGRTNFQFHEPYMRHRVQTEVVDYSFGGDEARQHEFDAAIRELILNTRFTTFGVAIRKGAFKSQFIETNCDPYLPLDAYGVAITFLMERYIDALANFQPDGMGRVRFESQGPREDASHQLEYTRVLLDGTQWVSASAFQSRLETGLQFSPKRGSDPIELADFFSRDLFEWACSECREPPKWWDLFCSKVYVRGDGLMGKFGIKVFPDSDIRDRIEQHRRECGALAT